MDPQLTSLEDEVTLLKLQNHHLNARLIDYVKNEAARTDQIASVVQENEVLREELASLVETIESYEMGEAQDSKPRLPQAFSDGLPVRKTPSPGPSILRLKRSVTSLGQRSASDSSSSTPPLRVRPQTSQGHTAPLRVRSASPSVRYLPPDPATSFSNPGANSSPPPTPTLNLLPPTPAPKRATESTQSVPPLPLDLGSVLTTLSAWSKSPEPITFSPEHSPLPSPSAPRLISRTSLGNPFSFTQQTLERCRENKLDVKRSEEHLQGLFSELSDESSTQEKSSPQDMSDHKQSLPHPPSTQLLSSNHLPRSISPEYDSDSDATSEADSASEVESLIAPQPPSNRSSIYSHSRKDSNMPEPTDMIFHLTQMMRLERKEREEEKARWEDERRQLLARTAAAAPAPSKCHCEDLGMKHGQRMDSGWDESCALPPAYDFLKPWTYPLPYSNMIHDIDQRLGKLLHQAQELTQEKRLFERLARASVDDCIDND